MREIQLEYRTKRKVVLALSVVLLLMVYFFKDSFFMLRVATSISALLLFYGADHVFRLRFRPIHYIFAIIMIIVGVLLSPLYYVYPYFDKIQHFLLPMLTCNIIFHTISSQKIELKWKIIFAFFITTSLLGLFEIGEYSLDYFFDLKLQGVYLRDLTGLDKYHLLQEPIDDTMVDLVYGFLGSALYSLASLFYFRKIRNRYY